LLVGQRLNVGIGSGRKRLNILGAYNPDDHDYVDLRTAEENLNAGTVIALMEKLQARHPDTNRFVLYLDNARYQHAKLVRAWLTDHPHFELHFLPPYSPNLNLIERLWKFLRKHALSCWHETFVAMQTAVANVLDHLDRYTEELQTLMTPKFHLVEAKT
jgi:transposase